MVLATNATTNFIFQWFLTNFALLFLRAPSRRSDKKFWRACRSRACCTDSFASVRKEALKITHNCATDFQSWR